jgi:hypothetical protein
VSRLAAVVAAALVLVLPAGAELAALCGALLALSQITTDYWIYFCAVWLLPFAMIAFASEHPDRTRTTLARDAHASPGTPEPALVAER